MGDLYVVQVVVEPRAGDPFPVRVDNVAFEKIKAPVVAESQIIRVPYEARIPPEESLDPPDYLGSYGLQTRDKVGERRRIWMLQGSPNRRPRGVDRSPDDGVADVCAEPLDIEGIVQERVPKIARVVGNVEDRVNAKNVGQHEEVEVQPMVPDHEPVIGQPAEFFRLLRDDDSLRALDRHQGGEEMGDRARATDPGQKRWNCGHAPALYRGREKASVVRDDELQIFDRFVFDHYLEAGIALDLGDGVYCYVSTRHAGEHRIGSDTSPASAKRKAPSSGILAPCRRSVSLRPGS